jgi:hypothetical protein
MKLNIEVMVDNLMIKTNKILDKNSLKRTENNNLIEKLKKENPVFYRHIIALIKIILSNNKKE